MKHTPGPWKVGIENDGLHLLDVRVYSGTEPIARVFRAKREQTFADASLISAAPDLLTALKAFERAASSWHEVHHDNPTTQCDSLCACIPAAQAAIAKAEGHV